MGFTVGVGGSGFRVLCGISTVDGGQAEGGKWGHVAATLLVAAQGVKVGEFLGFSV